MLKCNNCGWSNPDGSKFCGQCGRPISADATKTFIPTSSADAVQEDEERLRRLLDMAFWHTDAGNVDSALRACKAAIVIDPNCVSALSLLGSLYERQGNINEAIEMFEKVVALCPDSIADLQKLHHLKSGETLPPITPPPGYRWLPPVIAQHVMTRQINPIAVGIGAGAIVLFFICWGVVSIFSGRAKTAESVAPPSIPSNIQVASTPASNQPGVTYSPSVAYPQPLQTGVPAAAAPKQQEPPSQFSYAGAVNPPPQIPEPRISTGPTALGTAHPLIERGRTINTKLPSVKSVKPIDLTPAPRATEAAAVPIHTVEVAAPSKPAAAPSANASEFDSGPPAPAPRIEVHYHSAGSGSNTDAAPASHNNANGAQLQTKAIHLQNQGDYSAAASAYQNAISAFKADINAGRNTDFAKRGIEACETGLQICKQNQ